MKAGEKDAVRTLRMVGAAIKNREIELRHELADEDVVRVVQGAVKQRKEAIAQYRQGGRDDLVAQEQAEVGVLERYLPEQLSDEELDGIVEGAIRELAATGLKDMGAVMKRVLAACAGRVDGARVNAKVRERLT